MSNYSKALAAIVATILSGVIAALTGDNTISVTEWVNIAVLGAGACAIFTSPNVPGSAYTKSILAVITAVLTLAVSLLADGDLNTTDWLQLGMAALGALGVFAIPNRGGIQVTA